MISPASSTMIFMCRLQSNAGLVDAPVDRALVQAMYLNNGTLGRRIKLYVEKNFPD